MDFLVNDFQTALGDVIEVSLTKQANVKLMDYNNFINYRNGNRHTYYGGLAKQSPIRIPVPHAGHWYITVDLGGYSGSVSALMRVI